MKYSIFVIILIFSFNLFATIINIPEDYSTIQVGIVMSTQGDTVLVAPGTYYENVYYYMKNITVASLFLTTQDTSYISQTIIDGNQNGCVVTFISDTEDSTAVLCGFTIQNGYNDVSTGGAGGGIYIGNPSSVSTMPILENLIIKNNFAYNGGGIFVGLSAYNVLGPIIRDVIISENSSHSGGGICLSGVTSLERVTISNNAATDIGGGILSFGSANVSMSQVNIHNNLLEGFYSFSSWNVFMEDVVILENSGCGLYGDFGQLEIRNSIISNNSDGGIFLLETNSIIENVLISNNETENTGGGLTIYGGYYGVETIIMNSTIVSNSSDQGGGIYCKNNDSSLHQTLIVNSILWDNEPEQAYLRQANYLTTMSIHNSDIQNGQYGIVSSSYWPVFWGEGNIESDPSFFCPEENVYHLQDNSPCIGVGVELIELEENIFFTPGIYYAPENDIEGNLRPNPAGSMPDMGAYENLLAEPVGITNNQLPTINFQLSNYPNPFNPTTTISFNLTTEHTEFTEISIYNVKGQKIQSLINEQLPAGKHSVIWDGMDSNKKQVGTGVYFYKMKTSNFQQIKKMILLK